MKSLAIFLAGFILLYSAFKLGFYIGSILTSSQVNAAYKKQLEKAKQEKT